MSEILDKMRCPKCGKEVGAYIGDYGKWVINSHANSDGRTFANIPVSCMSYAERIFDPMKRAIEMLLKLEELLQ